MLFFFSPTPLVTFLLLFKAGLCFEQPPGAIGRVRRVGGQGSNQASETGATGTQSQSISWTPSYAPHLCLKISQMLPSKACSTF